MTFLTCFEVNVTEFVHGFNVGYEKGRDGEWGTLYFGPWQLANCFARGVGGKAQELGLYP